MEKKQENIIIFAPPDDAVWYTRKSDGTRRRNPNS
jgi:hypothetical protein